MGTISRFLQLKVLIAFKNENHHNEAMNPNDLPLDIMNFNLTPSSIISGVLFGLIGMWLYSQGKKRHENRLKVIAIALMFYPYFTSGPIGDWGVGIALCGAAYYYWKQ